MSALAAITEDPRQAWRTPRDLFDALHRRYRFDVDAAADINNKLLSHYWSHGDDGVAQLLDKKNDYLRAFVNPPYCDIAPWADAARVRFERGARTLLLLPARVDQQWFHRARGAAVVFVRGRIQFGAPPGVTPSSNREPSILLVFGWADQPRAIDAKTGAEQ